MGTPRHVLHVMNGTGGGAPKSTLSLIRALSQQGVTSSVVCDAAGTQAELDEVSAAVGGRAVFTRLYTWNRKTRSQLWKRPLIELRQQLRTGLKLKSAALTLSAARRFGAELVHTSTMMNPEGAIAASWLGLPHVWHVRELVGKGQPHLFPLEGEPLGRYLAGHASVVVANSQATAAQIADGIPPERLRVVYNGIDLAKFQPSEAKAVRPLVIAMVANLSSRWKKHGLFLEAAAQLAGRAELRLYGDVPEGDPYTIEIKRLARESGVAIMGFQPMERVVKEIDVLAHAADGESFGRTPVEAMAAGLPVVGPNAGGVSETVVDGETGLLFPPDDAVAMAAALARLLEDDALRERMGRAARDRALQKFSLQGYATQMLDVYRQAMEVPQRRSLEPLMMSAGLH
jgi:glycosyltransferase involved in cell wall biosynthesis